MLFRSVNAIEPGFVSGPRIEGTIAKRAEDGGTTADRVREELVQHVSLKRMVDADDIARTALFLCSEDARNISGQTLSVCGDVRTLV